MAQTAVKMVFFGILVLQMVIYSASTEAAKGEHPDKVLLDAFMNAQRRMKKPSPSDDDKAKDSNGIFGADDKATLYCIERVKDLTIDGTLEKLKGDEYIQDCLVECILNAKAGSVFDEDDFLDPECIENGPTARDLSDEVHLSTRKWRPFKKVGAWFRKNKDKIIKGLETAGRIIGGIIKAIGK